MTFLMVISLSLPLSFIFHPKTTLFDSLDQMSEEDRERAVSGLLTTLLNLTSPQETGLFPQDLGASLSFVSVTASLRLTSNQVNEVS